MSNGVYIGRNEEIDFLIKELSRSTQFHGPPLVFFVKGGEGSGKKSLFTRLQEQLEAAEVSFLWIRPRELHYISTPEELPEFFARSVECLDPAFQARIDRFVESMVKSRSASSLEHEEETRAAATSGAGKGAGGSPALSPESQQKSESWMVDFKRYILDQEKDVEVPLRAPRAIIVLDNYDSLSTAKKEWIARFIVEPVSALVPAYDIRFLLSGEQSISENPIWRSFWKNLATDIAEMELPPFTMEEVEEYLATVGLPDRLAAQILEESEGIPSRIADSVASLSGEEEALHRTDSIDLILKDRTSEQRNWLFCASFADEITEETLRLFLGNEEAEAAFMWLNKLRDDIFQRRDQRVSMKLAVRDAVRRWLQRNEKAKFREYQRMAQSFAEVTGVIPDGEHREKLAQLSAFNYFNPELLSAVFEETADSYLTFIKHNRQHFRVAGPNLQLVKSLQSPVANYRRLVQQEHSRSLLERIGSAWKRKRDSTIREMNEVEERIHVERSAVEEIERELNVATKMISLVSESHKDARNSQGESPRVGKELSRARNPTSLLLEATGTIVLYFSILFSNEFSLGYCTLGVLIILIGIFWPQRSAVPALSHSPAGPGASPVSSPLNTSLKAKRIEKDLRLLNFKKSNLEQRKHSASMRMARHKSCLSRLDELLQQPYR